MSQPIHPDRCQHGIEYYRGSFVHNREDHDVYVYDGKDGKEVCIRYGPKPHEYISPASLEAVLKNDTNNPTYVEAAKVLRAANPEQTREVPPKIGFSLYVSFSAPMKQQFGKNEITSWTTKEGAYNFLRLMQGGRWTDEQIETALNTEEGFQYTAFHYPTFGLQKNHPIPTARVRVTAIPEVETK